MKLAPNKQLRINNENYVLDLHSSNKLLQRRKDISTLYITLDGIEAFIDRPDTKYAIITNSSKTVEFAWETVEHIIGNGNREFRS